MALISVAQQNFQKWKFVFVVGEQQTVNRENSFFILFIFFGYLKYPLVTETGANRVPDNELIKSKGKKTKREKRQPTE